MIKGLGEMLDAPCVHSLVMPMTHDTVLVI
jgi:hypothetical protein